MTRCPPHDFGILGPLEVSGGPLTTLRPKVRAVLARLLIGAPNVVSSDRLIADVWGDSPADSQREKLWVSVSRLRQALDAAPAAASVTLRKPGYQLDVPPNCIDAVVFEVAVRDGVTQFEAGDASAAAASLHGALALWRGPALADLADYAFAAIAATRLEELRWTAIEYRVAADLERGQSAMLCCELEALTLEQPLRQRLWSHRMLALYRAGRQAEALRVYQQLRTFLVDEVGLEPAPDVRLLERAIASNNDAQLAPAC
jgi:DNA-binding SARP family transcriptional activator